MLPIPFESSAASAAGSSASADASASLLGSAIDDVTSLVWHGKDNKTRNLVDSCMTMLLETAPLFCPGRGMLAASVGINALAQMHRGTSLSTMAVDGTLGGLMGGAQKLTFDAIGASNLSLAPKALAMGVSSRLLQMGLNRQTYVDANTGRYNFAAGLSDLATSTFNPANLAADVVVFGLSDGIFKKLNASTDGALARSPLAMNIATGTTFGFTSGVTGEIIRERNAHQGFNIGQILEQGGISAAVTGIAAIPGGLKLNAMQADAVQSSGPSSAPLRSRVVPTELFSHLPSIFDASPASWQPHAAGAPSDRPAEVYRLGDAGESKLSPDLVNVLDGQSMSSDRSINNFTQQFALLSEQWKSTDAEFQSARDTEYSAKEKLLQMLSSYNEARDQVLEQVGKKPLPAGFTRGELQNSPTALHSFLAEHGPVFGIDDSSQARKAVGNFIEQRNKYSDALQATNGFVRQRERDLAALSQQVMAEHGLPPVHVKATDTLRYDDADYRQGNLRISRQAMLDESPEAIAGSLYHELSHHEQQSLIVRQIADRLDVGGGATALDTGKLSAQYQKVVGETIDPAFVKSVLDSRSGERLTRTQSELADKLQQSWNVSRRFNRIELQQIESELAKVRSRIIKLRGEGATAETRRILQSFRLDAGAVDRLVDPTNPRFNDLLSLQKQVIKNGMPDSSSSNRSSMSQSNDLLQDALTEHGINLAQQKMAIVSRYEDAAHEQIAFHLDDLEQKRLGTGAAGKQSDRRGLSLDESARAAGLAKYLDGQDATTDGERRFARARSASASGAVYRAEHAEQVMSLRGTEAKNYTRVLDALGKTPAERWQTVTAMSDLGRERLTELAKAQSDSLGETPRLKKLLQNFVKTHGNQPDFYESGRGYSSLRYESPSAVNRLWDKIDEIRLEQRRSAPLATERWSNVVRLADQSTQGSDIMPQQQISLLLGHFAPAQRDKVIDYLEQRSSMLSPGGLEGQFDDIADMLKQKRFLTEKNSRIHKYDSVKLVTFDPSRSDTAFAYLFQKYTGINVQVLPVRSAADLPPTGTKFMVFGDPPVGSQLEDALLKRAESGDAMLEMPSIDREVALFDLAQGLDHTRGKIATALQLKTGIFEPPSNEQVARASAAVGNAGPDTMRAFMQFELANLNTSKLTSQAVLRITPQGTNDRLEILHQAIVGSVADPSSIIYVTGADTDRYGGAGSSSLIATMFRRATGMTAPEYNSNFISYQEMPQLAKSGALSGKTLVFLDDASYTGQQASTISKRVAKLAGNPPDFDYILAFQGAFRPAVSLMDDAGIPHVEGEVYMNLPEKAKVKLSGPSPIQLGRFSPPHDLNLIPFYSVPNNTDAMLHDLLVATGLPRSHAQDFRKAATPVLRRT